MHAHRKHTDLLDMSRIVSGKVQLDVHPLDLGELLESAVLTQRLAADAKSITLDLDRAHAAVLAQVDTTRLQQVLWNLLSNAIKFTPAGGHISASVREAGKWAELSVRDSGVGISQEFLAHVFERFRQADGGSGRRFGGLGLGLAIVKQLIELHGGTVHANSAGEGCGATFTVRLPLCRDVARESLQSGATQDIEPLVALALKGMKILAVEDDAAMRELLARLLVEYGATVTVVSSAAAALEALRGAERFHLLLSDLGLSPTDGFALLRAVREQHSAEVLPAIAITAFSREEDRARAIATGFQAFVTKPYEVAHLVGLARKLGGISRPEMLIRE
jgi:CheY-like chemotaxis protein